jgi:hypothetical protein
MYVHVQQRKMFFKYFSPQMVESMDADPTGTEGQVLSKFCSTACRTLLACYQLPVQYLPSVAACHPHHTMLLHNDNAQTHLTLSPCTISLIIIPFCLEYSCFTRPAGRILVTIYDLL